MDLRAKQQLCYLACPLSLDWLGGGFAPRHLNRSLPPFMKAHDPRCEGPNEQKLLDDVAEHGWHVMKVLEQSDTPAWAYSIGLHHTFNHPEIVIFGQNVDLMHSMINTIGDGVRAGKTFEVDGQYPDLIEAYSCTFKPVKSIWFAPFLGFANWFYDGVGYPVLQCFWPDFDGRFPWESRFNEDLSWAQPLLFHDNASAAGAEELLESLGETV